MAKGWLWKILQGGCVDDGVGFDEEVNEKVDEDVALAWVGGRALQIGETSSYQRALRWIEEEARQRRHILDRRHHRQRLIDPRIVNQHNCADI